jgi:MAF protein
LLLASGSVYRQALLAKLGLGFETAAPAIDETPKEGESPVNLALRLSFEKAAALADGHPGRLIVGSDQVAVLDGVQLRKPGGRARAMQQLRAASGKIVEFYTGVCVLNSATGENASDLDRTAVHFRRLSDECIARYIDREPAFDCAGAFKSEGLGIALFEKIETEDPSALVGLPLIRLVRLLERFGVNAL